MKYPIAPIAAYNKALSNNKLSMKSIILILVLLLIQAQLEANKEQTNNFVIQCQIKQQLDIMRKSHQDSTEVHECAFQANIIHSNAAVKFSCKMFVAWKNMTNKIFCRTVQDNIVPNIGLATFNETLSFQTYLLYDKNNAKYLRKETSLCLLLVSARKPDEEKLVGRVVVDLGQILNASAFTQVEDHKLAFCSIPNATLTFQVKCLANYKTDMRPLDLDMDQFSIISKNLNQSGSSNNEDLVALKTITKDLSSHSADKRQGEKSQQLENDTASAKPSAQQQIQQTPKFETLQEISERKQSIQQVDRGQSQLTPVVNQPVIKVIEVQSDPEPQQEQEQQHQQKEQNNEKQQRVQDEQQVVVQAINQTDNVQVQVVEQVQQQPQQNPSPLEEQVTQQQNQLEIQQNVNQLPNELAQQEQAQPIQSEVVQQPATELVQEIQIQSQIPNEQEAPKQQPKQYTWYQEDPAEIKKYQSNKKQLILPELEPKNSADITELIFQNKKLQNQNQKLLQLYQKTNSQLQTEIQQSKKWKKQVEEYQSKLLQMQNEKNDIVQELLQQAQATSRQCIQLSNKLKLAESTKDEVDKLQRKLQKSEDQYEKSETQRLDIEAEALQLKYELSQLKQELDKKDRQLKDKDELIQKLLKQIDEPKPTKAEQGQRSLYRSYSIMSEKERQGFNQEIEGLKRKLNRLTNQLEFTDNVKDNLSHLTEACEQLSIEKQTLLFELSRLRRERDQLQTMQLNREKKDNQNLNHKLEFVEEQLKAVECELGRYEAQRIKLQNNINALEEENKLVKSLLASREEQIGTIYQNSSEKHEKITNTIKELQKQCEQLAASLGDKQSQLFKIQSELKNRQKLLAEKNKQIQSLNNRLNEKIQQIQNQKVGEHNSQQKVALLETQQNLLTQKVTQLHKQLQILASENKNKQALILSQEQNIAVLKSQWQREQNDLNNKIKNSEKQVSRLQRQAIQFKTVIDSLQGEKSKLQQSNKQHLQQKETLSNENEYLKAKVKDIQASASASAQANKNGTSQSNTTSYLQRVISDKSAVLELKQKQIEQMAQSMQADALKILELEDRISRFAEKEIKMRENILILEEQSRKIYDIVVEKEQNEEMQAQIMEEKDIELEKVRVLLDDQVLVNRIVQEQLAEYKKQLVIVSKQLKDIKEQKEESRQQSAPQPAQLEKNKKTQSNDGYNELLRLDNARINQLEEDLLKVRKQYKSEIEQKDRKISQFKNDIEKEIQSKLVMQHEIKLLRSQKSVSLTDIQKLKDKIKTLQVQLEQVTSTSTENQTKLVSVQAKQQQYTNIIKQKDNKIQQLLFRIQQLQLEWEQKQINILTEPLADSRVQRQNQANKKRVSQLMSQIQILETQLVNQEQQIKGLKAQLESANSNIKGMKSQIEDNQVEKLNNELEKQFQMVRDKSKEQIKKSSIMNGSEFPLPDIVSACKTLQEILKQRTEKDKAQTIIEMMAGKNAALEEEVAKIAEQRGVIQENARKLSMQFQKVKAKILKGKGSYQEKTQLLVSLKPCEGKVKDLVEITERIFDTQFQAEAF